MREVAGFGVMRELQHDGPVDEIVWSPDGRLLATGGWDSAKVVVREVVSGNVVYEFEPQDVDRPIAQWEGDHHRVASIAWSPNGRLIAIGLDGGQRDPDEEGGKQARAGQVACCDKRSKDYFRYPSKGAGKAPCSEPTYSATAHSPRPTQW